MNTVQYQQPQGYAAAPQQYSYPPPNQEYYEHNYQPSSQMQAYPSPVQQTSNVNGPQPPYNSQQTPSLPPKLPNHTFNAQTPHPQSQYQELPVVPPRHQDHTYMEPATADFQHYQSPQSPYEQPPPLPQRHPSRDGYTMQVNQMSDGTAYTPPVPPQRMENSYPPGDDPSNPIHYVRDPHKLVAYLVPFPKPRLDGVDPSKIPSRFLIYTPPPPPLSAPKEGEKEGKLHKVQRKWQQEVRSAKTSQAKVASWQGVKSRATKAIAWGVNQTTTSNIEFLGRVDGDTSKDNTASSSSNSSSTSLPNSPTTKKTVGVNEMLLVYPPSMGLNDQEMRSEFVNTMLRTKSKAQRDSIIATGLLPVGFGIDIMATLIWPFGGLGEIDSVWLYSSLRGAKTAHNVTKRLTSSTEESLHLNFTRSTRLDVLQRYLDAECHRVDPQRFPTYRSPPTESEVLDAIGWTATESVDGQGQRNWEDEMWEVSEVKDDVKSNFHKGAKEWKKFCVAYQKDPEKAMTKK